MVWLFLEDYDDQLTLRPAHVSYGYELSILSLLSDVLRTRSTPSFIIYRRCKFLFTAVLLCDVIMPTDCHGTVCCRRQLMYLCMCHWYLFDEVWNYRMGVLAMRKILSFGLEFLSWFQRCRDISWLSEQSPPSHNSCVYCHMRYIITFDYMLHL